MSRAVRGAGLVILSLAAGSCAGPGSSPSALAPVSRLWYDKPADAVSDAQVGRWATSNATFAARLFTSCDPATAENGVCPSLMVWAVPHASTSWCQLFLYAPEGETLSTRTYAQVARFPAPGAAGMAFSCGRPACEALDGTFTIHRLESNQQQVITTLHVTFEQACRADGSPLARLTGEVWIVDGTLGAPPGFPG